MAGNSNSTQSRTPIVAVMGHVDHGKTSLLDAIRGTRVVDREAGGITQNTRAHQVITASRRKITFIDTPGHEAFSAMRSRGAEVTDFVVLVVAADDGVQPQTKESIQFAHTSGVPIVLVINKIDIQGVNTRKVKQELASYGVQVEELGGEVMCFEVSATKHQGITELVEGIELLAEIQGLLPHKPGLDSLAEAYVLESNMDKQLGAVALCILKAGQITDKLFGAAAGTTFKTRAYLDQNQKQINNVNESDPFWVTGLKQPLQTGEQLYFFASEQAAKQALPNIVTKQKAQSAAADVSAGNLLAQILLQREAVKQGVEQKTLNVIVKASSQGTLEAVVAKLGELGDEEKKVRVLSSSTGEITESDLRMAQAAQGIVVSFQLPITNQISNLAKQYKVLVRNYEVIYEMIDELEGALDGLVEPLEEEVEIARAKVKKVFTLTNQDVVAGCEVIKGNLLKGYKVYIERPSQSTKTDIAEIGRGKITSLKIVKTEVKEVKKGQECGIIISPNIPHIQEGDEVVAYKTERQ